jgi:dipeptidyl aminopeptidase/acylaminoacyl peptidase
MASKRVSKPRAKRPFDVDALWAIKRIGSPTLASDGQLACAPVTSFSIDANAGNTELWLFPIGADGPSSSRARPRRLTAGDKDSEPRFSPDGTTIAFIAKRNDDTEPQVYLIAPDGGEATRLTKLATGAAGGSPTASGSRSSRGYGPTLQARPPRRSGSPSARMRRSRLT